MKQVDSKYTSRGAEFQMSDVFADLRDRWQAKAGKNSHALAARLDVFPQYVSQWASGSDPTKRAPLWALVAIASDLGLALYVSDQGIEIIRRRSRKAA